MECVLQDVVDFVFSFRYVIFFIFSTSFFQTHIGQPIITKFQEDKKISKFQSSYPPEVSVLAYLERIRKYARCSDSCFVVALIYIDRIIETRNVVLTSLNVHRLVTTAKQPLRRFQGRVTGANHLRRTFSLPCYLDTWILGFLDN